MSEVSLFPGKGDLALEGGLQPDDDRPHHQPDSEEETESARPIQDVLSRPGSHVKWQERAGHKARHHCRGGRSGQAEPRRGKEDRNIEPVGWDAAGAAENVADHPGETKEHRHDGNAPAGG